MNIRTFQGRRPQIAQTAYVDPAAIVIGDVTVGMHSSLWPMVVVRGDVNSVYIGDYSNVQDGTVIHCTHDGPYSPGGFATRIGNHVTIGHKCVIHACSIGDYALIGMSSTLMDGAVVNPRAMIGACSLVPPGKEVEGGYLWLGTPVRRVRPLKDSELESLTYSAAHYARLKDGYQSAK